KDKRCRRYPSYRRNEEARQYSSRQEAVPGRVSGNDHPQPPQRLSGSRMYDAVDDPYTYENSTILVNKLGLRGQPELDAFEAEISNARAEEPLPEGELDFTHYRAVHHHLFQDVYEWAGQIRTVRLFKGGNPFCFPENIEGQATRLFK